MRGRGVLALFVLGVSRQASRVFVSAKFSWCWGIFRPCRHVFENRFEFTSVLPRSTETLASLGGDTFGCVPGRSAPCVLFDYSVGRFAGRVAVFLIAKYSSERVSFLTSGIQAVVIGRSKVGPKLRERLLVGRRFILVFCLAVGVGRTPADIVCELPPENSGLVAEPVLITASDTASQSS